MINLDPSIVDQDKIRKQKRKKLFKTFLPMITILSLTGIFFLRPGFYNWFYSMSFSGLNFDMAESLSNQQKFLNVFEPYLASYNEGVADLSKAEFKKAENQFSESLKETPPDDKLCRVYVNLSYSIEKQGDEAFRDKKFDEALVLYNSAEDTLYNNDCAKRNDIANSRDMKAAEAQQRIAQKHNDTVKKMSGENGSGSDGEDGEKYPEGNVSDDDLQKILKEGRVDVDSFYQKNRNGYERGQNGGAGGTSFDSDTPRY